jgi:type IV fimbrial biogenesis protein FimT
MLTCRSGALEGFSLIELLITLAVLGIVLAIGLPNVSVWIQNTQLKTAAEGVVSGLQLARAEALRRNTSVRFQLVTAMDNSCALPAAGATTGANWVVSLGDPSGGCTAAPNTAPALIVQTKSGAEGSINARLAADSGLAVFTGLGRLITGVQVVPNLTKINVRNPAPAGGECQPPNGTGQMRCLSILVSPGGQVRMCDPAVTDLNDSRSCGTGFVFTP